MVLSDFLGQILSAVYELIFMWVIQKAALRMIAKGCFF